MKNKKHNLPKADHPKTMRLGIPAFNLAEKLTEVVPVKVQPSLKRALKHVTDNVSEFGRQALIEKLANMEEETS